MVTVASAVHAESHAATRIGPARTAGQAAQAKDAMAREFWAALRLAGTERLRKVQVRSKAYYYYFGRTGQSAQVGCCCSGLGQSPTAHRQRQGLIRC